MLYARQHRPDGWIARRLIAVAAASGSRPVVSRSFDRGGRAPSSRAGVPCGLAAERRGAPRQMRHQRPYRAGGTTVPVPVILDVNGALFSLDPPAVQAASFDAVVDQLLARDR